MCIYTYVQVLKNTVLLSSFVAETSVRRRECWRMEISFLKQRPAVMHAVAEMAVIEN